MIRWVLWRVLVVVLLLPSAVAAHPSGLVTVHVEIGGDGARVGVRGPAAEAPRLDGCASEGPSRSAGDWTWQAWSCEGDAALDLTGVDPTGARVAVQVVSGATVRHALVDPRGGPWDLVEEEARGSFGAFLGLGLEHIAGGADHLLFVAGLLFLVRGRRQLVLALTAFTVGHSLTLGAVTLGSPAPEGAPVEAWIAGSLVLLGRELLVSREAWSGGRAAALACVFGLVHGLGFAGALTEAGLPADGRLVALAGFNVGVELGQLAFVGAIGVGGMLGRRWVSRETARRAVAWALGGVGSAWLIGRTLALG